MAKDNGSNVVWFAAGVIMGAVGAVLMAPSSGRALRGNLMRKTEEGRMALADSGREVFDKGRDLYERGRQIADEAAEMFERGKRLAEGAPEPNQG